MTLLERDLNELAVRLQGQLTFKLDASMLTLTTNLLSIKSNIPICRTRQFVRVVLL
jgi:hypothetical protein